MSTSWGKAINAVVNSWVRDLNDAAAWGRPLIGKATVSSGWYSPRAGKNRSNRELATATRTH